jgi:tRNA threonylcarbamoyladenosine biosynthesis protein TsaB
LEAMARGVAGNGEQVKGYDLLCPMIDARRMEVYTAVFTAKGKRVRPTAAEIITESSFQDMLADKRILFFGDGSDKCKDALGVNPNAAFLPAFANSAEHLSLLAYQKFINDSFEDVAYFEPYYLKDFIAGKKAS